MSSAMDKQFSVLEAKMSAHKAKLRELVDIEADITINFALIKEKWSTTLCDCKRRLAKQSPTEMVKTSVQLAAGHHLNQEIDIKPSAAVLRQIMDEYNDGETSSQSSETVPNSLGSDHASRPFIKTENLPHSIKMKPGISFIITDEEMHSMMHTSSDNANESLLYAVPSTDASSSSLCDTKSLFKCFICKNVMMNLKALKRHLNRCNKLACTVCHRTFTNKKTVDNHMHTHFDRKEFKLEGHTRKHNHDKYPFKCNVCNAEFAREAYLRTHMRRHTGEKRFVCNNCGKEFMKYGGLQQHIQIHKRQRYEDSENRNSNRRYFI